MQNTPDDSVIKTPLVDRWLWPSLTPSASSNGVVVVGDAWHPMTPNLGQGACCALEDSVVLAKKLAAAMGGGQDSVDAAMQDYSQERWARIFPLTARSNLVGSLVPLSSLSVEEHPIEDGDDISSIAESVEGAMAAEEDVRLEVEAVQAVYGADCIVIRDFPPHVTVHIRPRTAEDSSQQVNPPSSSRVIISQIFIRRTNAVFLLPNSMRWGR
ncbi:hypothetical protein B296_00044761 [Ensete ventricosum]|uniref:FAD-binding domain-containing protein n=1 Tax=Ensete ventricosum TaxID=4639 RepID=A0A426YMF9_ENSVE|nr:hypothetical protein B296_00044761 [Ensete ventricosum]